MRGYYDGLGQFVALATDSTWLDDLKKDPQVYAAYQITGTLNKNNLTSMVAALKMHSHNNTAQENERLKAAKFLLSKL